MSMPETSRHGVPSFWRRSSIRRILQGVGGVLTVIGLGVTGYVWFGWDPFDALYMVVITITTVGYGEVRPLSTTGLRIHTMLVTVLGTVAVAYLVAGFVQLLAEGEIRKLLGHQRMRRQIEQLSEHTIVAGFGRVGTLVADDLAAAEIPVVVIERSPDRLPECERRGILYVQGDATDEEVLSDAGLERAKVLVTTISSDAEAVFITLTARQMAPGVMIVARAEQPTSLKKLRQAGANHVVVPAAIGARRIVSLLTNPSAVEFVELVTSRSSLAIEMDDMPIGRDSPLKGVTLRDSDIGRRTGVTVIAVKRADGRVEFPPSGDEPFADGDCIVVLGRRANLDQLRRELAV